MRGASAAATGVVRDPPAAMRALPPPPPPPPGYFDELAHQFARRRQLRHVAETHQNLFLRPRAGPVRPPPRRYPSAASARPGPSAAMTTRSARRRRGPARPPAGPGCRAARHRFQPGQGVQQLQQIDENDAEIGALFVRRSVMARAARPAAGHHRLEQVEPACRSVSPSISRPHRGLGPPRRPVRSPGRATTARRAPSRRRRGRSAPAPRADGHAFGLGDAAEMRRKLAGQDPRRSSNRWQRDSTVTGTLRSSVVAKMKVTWGGGSSSVFSSALNALLASACGLRR